jgi:hypothetical protein
MVSSPIPLRYLANVQAVKMELDENHSPDSRAMDSARSVVLAMEQGHNWTDAVRASLASTPHGERTGEFHSPRDGLS